MNTFILKFGNLITEKSDFIVNASNTELTLGSGVSQAFKEHCGGDIYQRELYQLKERYISQNGKIQQGDVLVSSSGSAENFTYALHIAVMNYSDDFSSAYPTYKHLQTALEKVLQIIEAISQKEKLQHPKLTIPLLGTGVGGLQKEKVYLLIKSILSKSKTELETVIYFHSKKDYLQFYLREK